MLVKDQLRVRMDQLGIPINELAKRLEVSSQSVRHWLSGRSFPGKAKTVALERALSFKIDFSEGGSSKEMPVSERLQHTDIETFLMITKLPPDVKEAFLKLAHLYVAMEEGKSLTFAQRVVEAPVPQFNEKGSKDGIKRSVGRPPGKKASAG